MKFIKRTIRYVWILVVLFFVVSVFAFNFSEVRFSAYASEEATCLENGKVYCNATVDDDFAEDKVTVVLNTNESARGAQYAIRDFSEIELTEVENLSQPQEGTPVNSAVQADSRMILSLTLRNPGKRTS